MSVLIQKISYRCNGCLRKSITVKKPHGLCFACRCKTCIACGEEIIFNKSKPGPKRVYCSYRCKSIVGIGGIMVVRNMRKRYLDPVYQSKQLGLIEIVSKTVRVTERFVKFV